MKTFTPSDLEAAFNHVLQAQGLKIGQVMPLYRLFVAGRMQGPGMFDVSAMLGRDEVIARLKAGLERCGTWV
jgi:glutamyl-tRNA synthetase